MILKLIFILYAFVSNGNLVDSKFSTESYSSLLAETKADLARSFFKREVQKQDVPRVTNISYSIVEELNITTPLQNGKMYRSSDENFIYNGVDVFKLEKDNMPGGRYLLEAVHDMTIEEGATLFRTAEWKNKIFLVICYPRNYCDVHLSSKSNETNLKFKISTKTPALDVNFFATHQNLYLVVVNDPVVIYRWSETYFNEYIHLHTTGAQTFAAFYDNNKWVMVIGQNIKKEKVYSKVYKWKNNNIELFQLLPTTQALKVIPFKIKHGDDILNFIFVLNDVNSSSIFWWTGKEFVLWKSLKDIVGDRIVFLGEIEFEKFFFISDKNKLYVYHPTPTNFNLMTVITFNQSIFGIDLREEKGKTPKLVLLTSAPHQGCVVYIISLKVNFTSTGKETKNPDSILECLSKVEMEVEYRDRKLTEINSRVFNENNDTGEIKASLKLSVESLKLVPIQMTIQKLEEKMKTIQKRVEILCNKIKKTREARYEVHDNLKILKMNANVIKVEKFNGKILNFGNVLSLTKNQTLTGRVNLETLATDLLTVSSINGIPVEEILLRNKPLQKISGEFSLLSLTADNIEFGSSGRINNATFSEIVTNRNFENLIKGRKVFSNLKVERIQVNKVNDVLTDEWLSRILPSFDEATKEQPLNFTNLSVEKLLVSELNGIPWNDFLHSVYLMVRNETIKGNVTVTGRTRVENLKVRKINGVPVENYKKTFPLKNIPCKKKKIKSLPFLPDESAPKLNDTFLKEILNDVEYTTNDEVRYFNGTKTIPGNLKVTRIYINAPMELSGEKVEPEKFKDIYWMKSINQSITVPVTFPKGFYVNDSMETNLLNNYTVGSYIWLNRYNYITTKLIFHDAQVFGNVELDENIDQNIDLRKLNKTSAKVTGLNFITGTKVFPGKVTTKHLYVGTLNNKDMAKFNLDHIKEYGFQDSKGNIEIDEMNVTGDLEIMNNTVVHTVNGINFNKTVSEILTLESSPDLRNLKYTSLNVKNLNVEQINGVNIEDKLPKFSKTQENDVVFVIEGNLEVPQLNATKINEVNFDKYVNQIFQRNAHHSIRGEKIFKELVTVMENLKGTINEYNITDLERTALSKTKAQKITGTFLVETLSANNVEARIMDGVPTDELLYTDESEVQVINSNFHFANLEILGNLQAKNFMNGCNWTKVTEVNVENIQNFGTLAIKDDITWNASREEMKGLSYFLSNVVTKSEDQIISGSVFFENDVVFGNVNGKRYFNDIDLEFMAKDAIYRSVPEQEISTPVSFKELVKVKGINILENVVVDTINDIDIMDFENKLVNRSADVVVRGKKSFKSGFSARQFNAESVNGFNISEIVFYGEKERIKLPATTFKKLNVYKNLRVKRINDHVMDDFFRKIFSKTKNQSIDGSITVKGNVVITGNANAEIINDINMDEVILSNGEVYPKVITGNIEFRDIISIDDKLQVEYINSHKMSIHFNNALTVDKDAIINGNLEFLSDVIMDGNLEVKETIAGCNMRKVTDMLGFRDDSEETNNVLRTSLREKVDELANITTVMEKPTVFMYLDEVANIDLKLPIIYNIAANRYNKSIELNIYGMNHEDCGLPSDCYCSTQTNLKIRSVIENEIEVDVNSTRFYKYHDEKGGFEVKVTTTTVSYSAHCIKSKEDISNEFTSISIKKFDGKSEVNKTYDLKIMEGYLSDVKFFKLDTSIYIILAFYFNPFVNQTNEVNTLVYEFEGKSEILKKVDDIPSRGTQVLEVFWTTRGVILVIGNSLDSDPFIHSVDSSIYRFNENENKFNLLRFIKTHGILSIKSLTFKKNSFIFLVQKQSWPLLILKYNIEFDNYYFSQKFEKSHSFGRSDFLSVSVIPTGNSKHPGDLFVGVVMSDDSFRFVKYKYIEGFVEEIHQVQTNVRILHQFWIDSRQYLLAASNSNVSKVYQFIKQGR